MSTRKRRSTHVAANGGKWIRPDKRLAIYLRDGLACVWCKIALELGNVALSLDHLTPHSEGGSNDASNLVTCCRTCNSSRQDRDPADFALAVSQFHLAETPAQILRRIEHLRNQPLDRAEAKRIIARRKAKP